MVAPAPRARSALATMGRVSIRDVVVSFGALLLAFAAFDDITTDRTATSFRVEYTALFACAMWFVFLAVKLIRHTPGSRNSSS